MRKLCCDTGFLGDPIDPVYEDRELFADFLTSYYTDHEPESCFLLDVDGTIYQTLAIPRAQVAMAVGTAEPAARRWVRSFRLVLPLSKMDLPL